jgi:hypothetical protein
VAPAADDPGEPPVAEVEALLPVEATDETAPAEVDIVPLMLVERQAERQGRSAAAHETASGGRSLAIILESLSWNRELRHELALRLDVAAVGQVEINLADCRARTVESPNPDFPVTVARDSALTDVHMRAKRGPPGTRRFSGR